MTQKYIPTTMVWNGKIYEGGTLAEVPEELEKAIDNYSQQESDKQQAELMARKAIDEAMTGVPTLDENGLVIKPDILVDPASVVDGSVVAEKSPSKPAPKTSAK